MAHKRITRREFIRQSSAGLGALAVSSLLGPQSIYGQALNGQAPALRNPHLAQKAIVLGMDGMDPNLLKRFIAEGIMPNFKRAIEKMHFGELQTTMPPHSPVAWASFISGCNPGGHGIFDFVHRDPQAFAPYLSTSRSFAAKRNFHAGAWNIPLDSGHVDLMRRGPAFWSVLEESGVPSSVFQIPANFPVTAGGGRQVSGMGTPDILGTYGTFTLFTDGEPPQGSDSWEGGRVQRVRSINHVIKGTLSGPKNPFRASGEPALLDLTINRDPQERAIKIGMQDQEIVLEQGEWSDWIPVSFEFLPMFKGVSGMVRFYAQEIHPGFRLYVSPINVDPLDASLPISSPAGYSQQLAQEVGRFYTQGFPADTKALSLGIFSDDEFFAQAKIVLEENLKMFEYQFSRFNEGCFFFYFSSVDQNCHMLLRNMDPTHPLYDPKATPEVKNAVRYFYMQMDQVLRRALEKVDANTTLVVLSDHGFAPFRREFHVSSWLVDNGFTTLTDPKMRGEGEFYAHVDWEKTRAYALGLNGIYVNLKGREKNGSVAPDQAEAVKAEIIAKLRTVRDPLDGKLFLTDVYDGQKIYSGPFVAFAPDVVVGYQSGYRISDEAVLGKFPTEIVGDRLNKWSSDHCLDPAVVPGVLLTNRQLLTATPHIWDLAPSILNAFGVAKPSNMQGQIVLG